MITKEAALSFILAVAIVAAGIWVANQSLSEREGKPAGGTARPADQQAPRGNSLGLDSPAGSDLPDQSRSSRNAATTPQGISKCTAGGKIVYSDSGCPEGAIGARVALHDSAGFVSPPKETVEELEAKRHARERAYAVAVLQQASVSQQNKSECEWLENRIAYLDSLARQPQSGQTQDWIRQERAKARDRQYALRCA